MNVLLDFLRQALGIQRPVLFQNLARLVRPVFVDIVNRHQRPAALHALRVKLGLILRNAMLSQHADQSAGRRPDTHAPNHRRQRPRRDKRTDARQCHRHHSGGQTHYAAHPGIVRALHIASDLLQRADRGQFMPRRVAGQKAHLVARETVRQECLLRLFSLRSGAKETCDCFGSSSHNLATAPNGPLWNPAPDSALAAIIDAWPPPPMSIAWTTYAAANASNTSPSPGTAWKPWSRSPRASPPVPFRCSASASTA